MTKELLQRFEGVQTPFYYYDKALLQQTLDELKAELDRRPDYVMHYAVKANANHDVLKMIAAAGLGADCVSGGEILEAIKAGFPADKIVFAGVGKADWEINVGLDNDIFCFNVESIPELEVINSLAAAKGKTARVCFRINPEVGAHTHANITTGLAENKFGIAMTDMVSVIRMAETMENVSCIGLHFHIGSQILEMDDFAALCHRVNELQQLLESEGICLTNINCGGGLGVDYNDPDKNPIPNFKDFFATYDQLLKLRPGQKLHFEFGRAIVAQCGSLITKTLYIKQGAVKQFAIVDAGFTDLIRPALYGAYHRIENISPPLNPPERGETNADSLSHRSGGAGEGLQIYDVVGPICESTDVFAEQVELPETKRGDLLALRSAGAYGEIMASQYNCRQLPKGYLW